MKKLIFVLSLCICFSACSSAYKVKSESQPAPDLKKYATIFIGWIDFGGDNWKELGYKGRDGWVSCFHELNVNWLQADLKERMSDKKLLFGSVTNNNPAGDLAVLFRNVRVTKSGIDDDYITMDVDFVALPGKKPLYTANLIVYGKGFGPQMYRFEGRLGFGMKNLGSFIAKKLD